MITVTTKEELELALKNKEASIFVKGDLAKVMQKKSKIKKAAQRGLSVAGRSVKLS